MLLGSVLLGSGQARTRINGLERFAGQIGALRNRRENCAARQKSGAIFGENHAAKQKSSENVLCRRSWAKLASECITSSSLAAVFGETANFGEMAKFGEWA